MNAAPTNNNEVKLTPDTPFEAAQFILGGFRVPQDMADAIQADLASILPELAKEHADAPRTLKALLPDQEFLPSKAECASHQNEFNAALTAQISTPSIAPSIYL